MALSRRKFLAASAAAASLSPLGVPFVHAAQKAAQYRIALVGSGWWGMNLLREAASFGNLKIVALCDVDQDHLDTSAEECRDLTRDEPKKYRDYREMLDKEQLDLVIVATPDHWHALNTIAALKKGCHVFLEKPTGHTILESRAVVEAARAADRVVQVGLHRRIGPHHVSGLKFLKDGNAGKIGMVRMFAHSGGGPELPTPNSKPAEGLDWEMYCGPAPLRPFNRKIHPGGFRNFLDFANGTLGDWGVHWLDQVLAWTDEKYPKRVFSTGGRQISGKPVLNEKEQTTDAPDTQVATYEFDSFTAVWEHRKYSGNQAEKAAIGAYFYGTKGTFHMGWRDGWTFYPVKKEDQPIHEKSQLQEPDGHNIKLLWGDFLAAIENKRRPVADIEVGHLSTNLSLLGMLSWKLGRSVEWDGAKEQIIGDADASQLLSRKYREPWQYPKA